MILTKKSAKKIVDKFSSGDRVKIYCLAYNVHCHLVQILLSEKNKDGEIKSLIEFTQMKTGKIMTIPLHKKVLSILEKRDGNFPRKISDQRYNEYIKKVCELAGINQEINGKKQMNISKSIEKKIRNIAGVYPKYELITSHIGRRSFATNYYGSIPTTYLINMTGHSTEAIFLNYIGKSNKDLAMELSDYF